MTEPLSAISSMFDLIVNSIGFLSKLSDKGIEEEKRKEAKRLFYLIAKLEMSLVKLILYLAEYQKKILRFSDGILRTEIKKGEFKSLVDDVLSVFPIPEIPELTEEDVFSLGLNLMTKYTREMVSKTNLIAKSLKANPYDMTLLSQFSVNLTILGLLDPLFEDYESLIQTSSRGVDVILGRKGDDKEIAKTSRQNVIYLKEMCKLKQRASEEFDKKYSEIKEKINLILESE